jgi:hypothetical protein
MIQIRQAFGIAPLLRIAPVLGMALFCSCKSAALCAATQGVWTWPHTETRDNRVIRDRLHARNNQDAKDYSFLNAVGAVWSSDIGKSGAGHSASSGFLIDRCHVLTNLHAVYTDEMVVNPPLGRPVVFAVGQTEVGSSGALQGLKFLLDGEVVAVGDAIIVDGFVHDPENDWALIRLDANVDAAIRPMTIATVDAKQLRKYMPLSTAGFPADRRNLHGDRIQLKDLWGSDGYLVAFERTSTAGGVIESTVQATRGNSGGPLYGDFNGQPHIVIGMQQGIRGNGIDVSESAPNLQVFFTADTFARILAAQARTACR